VLCLSVAAQPPLQPTSRAQTTKLFHPVVLLCFVRYSTFDRELTAVFSALRHFCFMLEGRQFHIMTDHKPLVAAFRRVSPLWSARQQRQLAYIKE
jgi:RNase H-like domain found in reverse transcriptase